MKKFVWLFILILAAALFLRLFRLTELFHFTMDEELIAWRAYGLFKLDRPFLIGGISPLQVHLPPYFYYLMALLIWPFNFNPIGWGISGAIVGVATVIALFFLVKKLFDQKTALIAAILQTFSFTAIFFDRHFWPMSLSPLLIILSLYLLVRLDKKSLRPYLGLSAILLLALSADPSNLTLALALLIWFIISRRVINLKFTFIAVSLLLIGFFTPLFLFDLRHQWQNFGGVSRLFQTASSHQFELQSLLSGLLLLPKTLARFWFSAQTNLLEVYSYCSQFALARQSIAWGLLIPAIGVIAWFMVKVKNLSLNLLLGAYVIGVTLFGSLGFSLFDHYLTGLMPIFALMSAVIIRRMRFLGIGLLVLFVGINLWQISRVSHPYGLKYKQALVEWANRELQGQPYSLESVSKCHRENGLRYLLELSGNPPQQSFMDPNFSWLYPQRSSLIDSDRILIVTDKDYQITKTIIFQKKFGAVKAYILLK